MTSFAESVWAPTKGKGPDLHWGGGALYVRKEEFKDNVTGMLVAFLTVHLCIIGVARST